LPYVKAILTGNIKCSQFSDAELSLFAWIHNPIWFLIFNLVK